MCAQDSPRRSAATLRVRRPSGRLDTFEAEHVTIDSGLVTVIGCYRNDRQRRIRRTFSRDRLLEIRWADERVAAA
jgi:hypothetical protein